MTDQTRQAPIQFRGLEKELDRRGEQRGMIAKRDLQRYYYMLKGMLNHIILREHQAKLICEVWNPSRWRPESAAELSVIVQDAINEEGLAEKWGIEPGPLLSILNRYGNLGRLAIADAAEQFWYLKEKGDTREDNELLVEVGLLKKVVL